MPFHSARSATRYSICALAGAPGARSRAISPGVTQPSAVFVIELAKPTTVRAGAPGAPVTESVLLPHRAKVAHPGGRAHWRRIPNRG